MPKTVTDTLLKMEKDDQIAYLLCLNASLEMKNEVLSKDNISLAKFNASLSSDLVNSALDHQQRLTDLESDHRQVLASMEFEHQQNYQLLQSKHDNKYKLLEDKHDKKYKLLEDKFNSLVEQIKIMNARFFGAKSEKISPYQISLFNDMESSVPVQEKEPQIHDVLPRKRKKKSSVDYSKFETVVIEHVLEEKDRICFACGEKLTEMGVETKHVIRLVPAHLVVEEHRRHVYGCKSCSKANAQDAATPVNIIKSPLPKFLFSKSFASPSLLAHIIYQKYCLALPLYRIANDLKSQTGLTLTRQTMAGWVIGAHERWLAMIYALMKAELLKRDIIHCDETRTQVLKEPERAPSKNSYMWLFAGAKCDLPIYIFEYHMTRSRSVVTGFLDGWAGTIITDGYAAYDNLGSNICRVSCLVHIRRKFSDVIKGLDKDKLAAMPGVISTEALRQIEEIFHVDNGFEGMSADQKKQARLEKLKPKMDMFVAWCKVKRAEVTPSMALANALNYAIGQWSNLENMLLDGRLPIENNLAENAIRPFAIGRKNWLFSDTQKGAYASAAMYSILTTAKANGLKPREYLEWLFAEMPSTENLKDRSVLSRFLPWSDMVPETCRMNSSDDSCKADPLNEAICDVDPSVLDED
jgi:transposase